MVSSLGSSEANVTPTLIKTISIEYSEGRSQSTHINPAPNYTNIVSDIKRDQQCKNLPPSWIVDSGQEDISRSFVEFTISQMSSNEFPPHLFYHFCRLRHLTLANQRLKQIEANDFKNAHYLNYLDLSGNDIERIEANVFNHAANLSIIDLANNNRIH